MKPQDIIFILVLIGLFFKRSSKLPVITGLVLLVLSIPLFATWTFFTAERFTWYAAAFFFMAIIFNFFNRK